MSTEAHLLSIAMNEGLRDVQRVLDVTVARVSVLVGQIAAENGKDVKK